MNKNKYLLKNLGILTISNFASKILVLLLVPLYTAVLTTAEYGSYDLAVSTATLFYPIVTLNIVDAVMRFSMDKNVELGEIVSIGFRFVSLSCILVGFAMFFFNRFHLWPDIYGLEIYIFLYYMSYVSNQFLIQFSKGLERVSDMGIAGVISTVVTLTANILFLIVLKMGLVGFFFANIIAQVISALYLATRIRLFSYINFFKVNKSLQKEMLVYSIPLMASVLGWWVNSTADKYVVVFLLGVSANGLLSVAYKIPQIINTFQSIFIQAWQISAIIEYGEEDTDKFYGKTFVIINLLMCSACSWLILFSKLLAHILYANDFYLAWRYVPFLLISSVLNCASGLLGPILSAQKNTKAMMWSAVIGAAVNIVMNIVFVYFIGIQGATIATVICSYIIYALRKKAVDEKIYIENYSIVVVTWLLLCLQAIIEIYCSWYFEFLIIAIIFVLNFKVFKEFIYMMLILVKTFCKAND